jgi:hypothetical protein
VTCWTLGNSINLCIQAVPHGRLAWSHRLRAAGPPLHLARVCAGVCARGSLPVIAENGGVSGHEKRMCSDGIQKPIENW